MCGIVGAVAQRNIVGVLIEGLRRLEYRGYDSSGLSFLDEKGDTCVYRNTGKVKNLANSLAASSASGFAGIAHTRWATH